MRIENLWHKVIEQDWKSKKSIINVFILNEIFIKDVKWRFEVTFYQYILVFDIFLKWELTCWY